MLGLTDTQLIKSASYFSVLIATIVMSAKLYGYLLTSSQSMLASLVDSMLDISSSLINLIAIKIALQPPDNNHRFGHEKFQDLAIFSQSIFFCASSIFTMFSSIKFIFNQEQLNNSALGVDIIYLCLFLTLVLVIYQNYVVKKTSSKIIAVDKLHYLSDFLTNLAVLISIAFSTKYWFIDPLTAVGIAIFIMYSSYGLFRYSIKNLADEEFADQEKDKILNIISKYTAVQGVHDLKTRYAASKSFIQFHLEMDGKMSLEEAHKISENITQELLTIFIGGEIIIHQDPIGADERVSYREKLPIQ